MSKRLTISVPDDVAARLSREPNVSAFVTETVRRRMSQEATMTLLADHGIAVTPEGLARARALLIEADGMRDKKKYDELRKLLGK